jgi:uncharacterized membrane protein YcaP (DUF421 family)
VDPHPPFFFDGWYLVGRTATLSFLGFVALFTMLRISGKRTLSELNVFDFVFVVCIGSVFAATIIEKDVTLVEGIVALGILIVIQVFLAKLAAYSKIAERIINGRPTRLLTDGKYLHNAMRKQRVTEEEVRAAIRAEGVTRVEDVDAVVLENDGSLTVAWNSKRPGRSALVDAKNKSDGGSTSEEG